MSKTLLNRPNATRTIAGQNVHSGMLPKREGRNILKGSLFAVSTGIGMMAAFSSFIPIIGQWLTAPTLLGASHVVDRVKNSVEANDELAYRAKYYSAQIFKTLGIKAREGEVASVSLFKQAAAINPELSKLYKAPLQQEKIENRTSMLTNGSIAAAGALISGGGAVAAVGTAGKYTIEATRVAGEASKVAKIAKGGLQTMGVLGSGMAGGAIAKAISGEVVDPQELLEGIHKTVAEARARGMDTRDVVSPHMLFMLRVSQDAEFAKLIKQNFKKPFHKMNEAEQTQVMLANPALANAVTSEATAIANGILSVQELGASKPNLNSMANQYAVGGGRNSSFADRLNLQRAAAAKSVTARA
jgi:hypothetical protein